MTQELPGYWTDGPLPANARVGAGTVITGDRVSGGLPFARFRSQLHPGLVIGARCTMDGVVFNVGPQGRIVIGDDCRFEDVWLLCELELRIGARVVIGWHATIVDADFHPLGLADRIADTIACSPLGAGRPRLPGARRAVVIEDDVLIGPNATILKGVRVGAGAFVEAGAVIVHDVPPGARVLGNPACVVGSATAP